MKISLELDREEVALTLKDDVDCFEVVSAFTALLYATGYQLPSIKDSYVEEIRKLESKRKSNED